MISAHAWACESTGCLNGTRSVCDWPVEVEVKLAAIKVNVGDAWLGRGSGRGEIVHLEYFDAVGNRTEAKQYVIKVRIWVKGLTGSKEAVAYDRPRFGGAGVRSLRMVPCGRYACDNHVRELSDTRHYCAAHWRSWESV